MPKIRSAITNLVPIITHGLAAVLPTLVVAHPPTTPMLAVAFAVGNLPDIDTSYSHIGRILYPLARRIESRYGHRTVTHSLLVVSLIAAFAYAYHQLSAIRYLLSEPWAWWWWPTWYATHLLIDMIIGGKSGIPLLWPSPLRFFLAEVEPGSPGERATAAILAVAVVIAAYGVQIQPARILHERAGTLDFALQDYRAWEPWYHVLAEVEATDQRTHRPVAGIFEIVAAQGQSLVLRDPQTGQTWLAGQRDEPLYIRRIVASQGPPRRLQPISNAQPTPTPVYVKVVVHDVTDPDRQILVAPGDHVEPDTVVADLAVAGTPSPTPSSTPTAPPTATWAPEPARVAQAELDLALARAQATADAQAAQPDPLSVQAADAKLALAARSLQQAQAAYDRVAWQPDIASRPEALELERSTNAYHLAVAEATRAAQADAAALRVAQARLALAEWRYRQAIATPTPPPTGTPTPPPPPTSTPEPQQVRALVTGTVTGWRIVEVRANRATVEIYIALPPEAQAGSISEAQADRPGASRARTSEIAILKSVTDGDTLHVEVDGREDKVRLIGVDTPEITKGRRDCYGQEAAQFTGQFIRQGEIRLEGDIQERDKYGRLLAYVWVGDQMLNEVLVREGYARARSYPPNIKYQPLFQAAEAEAHAQRRGLWGSCQ